MRVARIDPDDAELHRSDLTGGKILAGLDREQRRPGGADAAEHDELDRAVVLQVDYLRVYSSGEYVHGRNYSLHIVRNHPQLLSLLRSSRERTVGRQQI